MAEVKDHEALAPEQRPDKPEEDIEYVGEASASAHLEAAAEGKLVADDHEQIASATDWVLRQAKSGAEDVVHSLTVNVGSPTSPKRLAWQIKAVDGPILRKIRERAADETTVGQGSSRQPRAGAAERAQYLANVRVVLEGTVEPPLRSLAGQAGIADPELFVEMVFQKKPGLVEQLAGMISALSGYDTEDVQDAKEVAAAGNS